MLALGLPDSQVAPLLAVASAQVVRTSLVPGLLKTLSCNKEAPLPVKIFEVSDVVELDPEADVGARNIRRAAVLFSGATSGFEVSERAMPYLLVRFVVAIF